MKRSKLFYAVLVISIAILTTIFVLGTIFDVRISKILVDLPEHSYYSQNIIAILGHCFGENTLYILLVCSFIILFYHLIKNRPLNKVLTIFLALALIASSVWTAFYCINKTLNYISLYTDYGLEQLLKNNVGEFGIFCVSLVATSLGFLGFKFVSKETLKNLMGWAWAVLIVSLISNLIVQTAQGIFSRPRYTAMLYEDKFSYYVPWYKIGKKFESTSPYATDFFRSFPSGHVCAGSSIFLLTLLPSYIKRLDKVYVKATLITISAIYTICLALSRIVAGGHFFTDVFVGGFITISLVLLYKWIYIDIIREKRLKKKLALATVKASNLKGKALKFTKTEKAVPTQNLGNNKAQEKKSKKHKSKKSKIKKENKSIVSSVKPEAKKEDKFKSTSNIEVRTAMPTVEIEGKEEESNIENPEIKGKAKDVEVKTAMPNIESEGKENKTAVFTTLGVEDREEEGKTIVSGVNLGDNKEAKTIAFATEVDTKEKESNSVVSPLEVKDDMTPKIENPEDKKEEEAIAQAESKNSKDESKDTTLSIEEKDSNVKAQETKEDKTTD